MTNKLKETDVKNHTNYFLDGMIDLINLDQKKIKIDIKPLNLIINKIKRYIEKSN